MIHILKLSWIRYVLVSIFTQWVHVQYVWEENGLNWFQDKNSTYAAQAFKNPTNRLLAEKETP